MSFIDVTCVTIGRSTECTVLSPYITEHYVLNNFHYVIYLWHLSFVVGICVTEWHSERCSNFFFRYRNDSFDYLLRHFIWFIQSVSLTLRCYKINKKVAMRTKNSEWVYINETMQDIIMKWKNKSDTVTLRY